jgi:hypothetical protein
LFTGCPPEVDDSEDTGFTVTIGQVSGNGTITANPMKGPAGTEISVWVNAAQGNKYVQGSLKYNSTPISDSGNAPYTFILISNVTLTAQFEQLPANQYSVTVASTPHGNITANPAFGTAGTTITLTISPDQGYVLKANSLTYTPAGGSAVAIAGHTFSLPASHVTVNAVFETGNLNSFLDAGIRAMEEGNYDTAISCFDSAYALENNNQKAIVYSTLSRLAAIAVDSQVRTLVSDRLGITGYPGTLNSLVSLDWMDVYTDEKLARWYYDGDDWYDWYDENDSWFFDDSGLERKSGYYQYTNTRRLILGETAKLPGGNIVSQYYDDDLETYVNWHSTAPADETSPGYYYYDSVYRLITSEPKYDNGSLIEEYYDDDIGKNVHWYTNGGPYGDGSPQGYYYFPEYVFVSSDPIYGGQSYYYDDSYPWYYWRWYDSAPSSSNYTYTGFTTPGYYRQVTVYELVSETPRYTTSTSRFPGMNAPSWFSNTNRYKNSLTSTQLKSSATSSLLMFTNLVDKNTNGLNTLLDDLLSAVFGDDFEAAYDRAATLNESIKLNESTLEAFGISDIFEGDVYIGKAELNLLFAALRIVKASLEWVAAYDWNTDLNFLKNGPLWDDLSNLSVSKPTGTNLPLRNNFLKDRNNGMMAKSKADFIKAIDDSIAAYDLWIGNGSNLPQGYKDTLQEYAWAKQGFTQLKTAINSGGTFYVKVLDSGATYTNTKQDALVGIDMGKFFTSGQLAINGLIDNATITGKGAAPKFYGYDEQTDNWVEITQKTQLQSYEVIGFKLTTQTIKQIVIYGFEEILDNDVLPLFTPDFAGYIWDWYNQ